MPLQDPPRSALVSTLVDALVQAHQTGTAWQPAAFDPALTPEDAYAVQDAVATRMGWFAPDGHAPAWKAGGKPPMGGAPLPVVLTSGSTWQPGGSHDLIVEAEVAFQFARTPASADDVMASIGSMGVSIEIVGTRMANGLAAPGPWKTADQGVHGVLVFGEVVPFAPRDWMAQTFSIAINGKTEVEGKGSHPNGDAPLPLPWLFGHAMERGRDLRAGDIVTTGAWGIFKVQPGDRIEVAFPGIGAASVTIGTR